MSTSSGLPEAMSQRLGTLEEEFVEHERMLSDAQVIADPNRLRQVSQRYSKLEPVVQVARRYRERAGDAGAARELLSGAQGDDRAMAEAELASAELELEELESALRDLLLPPDPYDGKGVILEIRGAEGGEEANLFARDLYEMYVAYAERHRWKLETLARSGSDLGGFNEVTFIVHGVDAWAHLKFEGGPHRVQRVPATESQGRVHTSSATVLVLPEADEVDVRIDDGDLDIDVYRSSGPGGQSVNTTDSAVRITHRPTGTVVAMQDERSQLQNRMRAMQVLRARLFELAERERATEMSVQRRSQVGGGGRSEKIRTYNYKDNRVTDHRIGLTLYRLTDILAGDLDQVVEPLRLDERSQLLTVADAGS